MVRLDGIARAQRALAKGHPLLAYDLVSAVLRRAPGSVRGRQLQAHALARSGASAQAARVLEALRAEGADDEETLGLLASVTKDLALRSRDGTTERLREACDLYHLAYERHGSYWAGINDATLALLTGDPQRARSVAEAVRKTCASRLAQPASDDRYWLLATIAETWLVVGNIDEAERWYAQAVHAADGRVGHLAATRRNAQLLLTTLGFPGMLDRVVPIPRVVVFTGHRIDEPNRPCPRFREEAEPAVAAAIRREVRALRCGVGYASAASGADILFHEAVLETGGEIHVVLPFEPDEFVRTSVGVGTRWERRFRRVLARAREAIVASPHPLPHESSSFRYANELLLGLTLTHARQLESDPAALCVWDGEGADGAGGTAEAIAGWRRAGLTPVVIDPATVNRRSSSEVANLNDRSIPAVDEVVSMLFADVVGYSRFNEAQIADFASTFLPRVRALIDALPDAPVLVNTWGDGLFVVQRSPGHCAELALAMSGLSGTAPGDIALRVALHAGPAMRFVDPLTGRLNVAGAHVSRAARIEPITPPGQVYASQAFVALLFARGAHAECEYVGSVPLAKHYGRLPMYHLTAQHS